MKYEWLAWIAAGMGWVVQRQHFAEASTKHKNRRTGKEQTQRRPRSLYKRKVTPDSLPKAVDVSDLGK